MPRKSKSITNTKKNVLKLTNLKTGLLATKDELLDIPNINNNTNYGKLNASDRSALRKRIQRADKKTLKWTDMKTGRVVTKKEMKEIFDIKSNLNYKELNESDRGVLYQNLRKADTETLQWTNKKTGKVVKNKNEIPDIENNQDYEKLNMKDRNSLLCQIKRNDEETLRWVNRKTGTFVKNEEEIPDITNNPDYKKMTALERAKLYIQIQRADTETLRWTDMQTGKLVNDDGVLQIIEMSSTPGYKKLNYFERQILRARCNKDHKKLRYFQSQMLFQSSNVPSEFTELSKKNEDMDELNLNEWLGESEEKNHNIV